jgi:hypothetical protein
MGAEESGMTAAAAADQKSERDEMTSMSTVIVEADLSRPDHQQAVLALTAAYARRRSRRPRVGAGARR